MHILTHPRCCLICHALLIPPALISCDSCFPSTLIDHLLTGKSSLFLCLLFLLYLFVFGNLCMFILIHQHPKWYDIHPVVLIFFILSVELKLQMRYICSVCWSNVLTVVFFFPSLYHLQCFKEVKSHYMSNTAPPSCSLFPANMNNLLAILNNTVSMLCPLKQAEFPSSAGHEAGRDHIYFDSTIKSY